MNKICIIGRGNVATHLSRALTPRFEVKMVNPHDSKDWPLDSDLWLIAVADSAIEEVALRLKNHAIEKQLPSRLSTYGIKATWKSLLHIAHTSGSVGLEVLSKYFDNVGVFYPLQTFSKDVEMDYSHLPIFIEGANEETIEILKEVASFSDTVHRADSSLRSKLHLAAVFACNFANHMWTIADRILQTENLDIHILEPLINETLRKAMLTSPSEGQTGPAVRRDHAVIAKQEKILAYEPELQNIYRIITNSIINYGEATSKSL